MERNVKRRKLKTLHNKGLDGSQIGRELGVSRQRVSQLRKAYGLMVEPPHIERRKQVAKLADKGMTAPQIRKALQMRTSDQVWRDADALGIDEQLRANRQASKLPSNGAP